MAAEINWDKCGHKSHCESLECFLEENAWLVCSEDGENVLVAAPLCVTLATTEARLEDDRYTEVYDCYQAFIVRREEWNKQIRAFGVSECPERGWWIYVECSQLWYRIAPYDGLPPWERCDRYNMKWMIHTQQQNPCFTWTPPDAEP